MFTQNQALEVLGDLSDIIYGYKSPMSLSGLPTGHFNAVASDSRNREISVCFDSISN